MSRSKHRIDHLEKHPPILPHFTDEELDDLGFSVWRNSTDGRPPTIPNDETLALPHYLALPLEQRQHWRNLGRRYIHYAILNPHVVSDILEDIVSQWPAFANPD
jgi:hypothetical protein